MLFFPPLPPWNALHPLVVHIPIGALLVGPFFLIIAMFTFPKSKGFALASLLLMAIGSAGAMLAVETGEAAAHVAHRMGMMAPILHQHAEMGEWARTVFVILTALYAAMLAALGLTKLSAKRNVSVIAHGAFLVLYLVGTALLANAGHLGGRVVHEYGVHAVLTPTPDENGAQSPTTTSETGDKPSEAAAPQGTSSAVSAGS